MKLSPFRIERFYARYEFTTRYMLSSSDCESRTTAEPDDVIVASCAEEGIFLLYHALLGAGDHAIVETPCYESALQVARSTGAEVYRQLEHDPADRLPAACDLYERAVSLGSISKTYGLPGLRLGWLLELLALQVKRH